MSKVLSIIADIILWILASGTGFSGVIFAIGAISYFRKIGVNDAHDYKTVAIVCVVVSLILIGTSIGCFRLALDIAHSLR